VVNGGKMGFAMELILTPVIHRLIEEKKRLA
jgi:phosphoribulokinase